MFTEKDKENRTWFCDVRERIINLLDEEGVESWEEAAKVLASTLNEILVARGYNVEVTLRPLVFCEDNSKK